ncbi:MAG: 50S ribosomal protein L4, partial [Deltaproteobacteria bacterium CG07_land_8_20_14_0_80_38_7]
IYDAVKAQLASRRQGDAFCKNRALVSGSTHKIYRQKGTGRARHSSRTANIFVGGGKAFGPKPRDYFYAIPKKARLNALRVALSVKKKEGMLILLDGLTTDKPKTSVMVKNLEKLGVKSALIVINKNDENLKKSLNNIPKVKLLESNSLNIVDILSYDHLVMTKDALTNVQEILKP